MVKRFGCLYVFVNMAWSKSASIDQPNIYGGERTRGKPTAIECILVWRASRIGYFKTCSALYGVVVKVQI